jgi:hypothetical protein
MWVSGGNQPFGCTDEEVKMTQGTIKFENATSEFLSCSCGNDVMDSGFDAVESNCEDQHYVCNACSAIACIDFAFRYVNNIDAAQAGIAKAVR